MALRWVLAGSLLLGAIAVVLVIDPTTCDIDVCRTNGLADLGVFLAGVVGAILALNVGKR